MPSTKETPRIKLGEREERYWPSLRGALATKQSSGRVPWSLDGFAALAITVELTQQLLGIA